MKILFLSLILALSVIDTSLASGSYVGNGGDTIFCHSSPNNDFKGHYTLDYLLEFRETNQQGPIEIVQFSETVKRLSSFLASDYPELFNHFNEFMVSVRADRAMFGRHWMEEKSQLIDIKDENIQKLIPTNCMSEVNGEYHLKLYQTVIRESGKDPIRYHYDRKILEELEKKNPLQYSFFIVHEWLWDLTRDVRTVRKLNWLLHSEKLSKMSREELSTMFDRYDVFKVKLNTCEKSSRIKNLFENDCEKIQLKDLAEFKSLKISGHFETPFRMGDFFGFGRVETLSLVNLNLQSYELLPRLFFPLYTLKHLDLSHNQISDLSGEVAVDLKDLKSLDISFNPLKVIPDSFYYLKNLEDLTLPLNNALAENKTGIENLPASLINLILIKENVSDQKTEAFIRQTKAVFPNLNITVKK